MASSHLTIGSGDRHVMALHGWFGSARGWGSLPEYLDGSAFTYVFPDLRGYGGRRDVAGEFTMAEAAADALALADELGWERFAMVGHSMSGKAVQHAVLQAPGRVTRLVALNPVPATGVPFDDDGWALFSGAATARDNRAAIITMTTGGRLSPPLSTTWSSIRSTTRPCRPSGRTWSRGPGRISPGACTAIRSRSRSSSGNTTRPCRRR